MFVRKVDAKTTPIAEVYDDWERIWMGEKEIRRFLAYTGLSAPPYNLRVEHFLKFLWRGISAANSCVNCRNSALLGVSTVM